MPPSGPIYKLADVQVLAADASNIDFHGLEAQKRSMGLGYSIEDVAHCIARLSPSDYHKRLVYKHGDPPTKFDVYKTRFKLNQNVTDYLYIKLALNGRGKLIIGSFKLV